MSTIICIVDYHNFYPFRREGHRNLLEHELNKMVQAALDVNPAVQRVEIRLYGGWYEDGVLTKEGSELQEDLQLIDFFPWRHPQGGLLHGTVELIARLAALPNVDWDRTLKQVKGLTQLRVETGDLPPACKDNEQHCPVLILRRFARRKQKLCGTAGCDLRNAEVFARRQQKMVDAMMVCDVIELIVREDVTGVIVFTDDIDVLPGLAVARPRDSASLKLVLRNKRLMQQFTPFLRRLDIEHASWE